MKTGTDTVVAARGLGLALNHAARLLKSEFERRSRCRHLSLMQWRTLSQLDKQDGLSQAALASRIDASPMTMSDILDRLETLGYVQRGPDPNDSRAKLVHITDAATPALDELREIAADVYSRALDGISQADRETLLAALKRIVANLDATQME
jgi:DNA-binding MarR family transcriptional regulator